MGKLRSRLATGAAVVNVITRSGTNDLHGSAFEFIRNQLFDARGFFDGQKAQYQQNQFGGSIGGPIKKNKTFFFGDYEGSRNRRSAVVKGNAPLAAWHLLHGVRMQLLLPRVCKDPLQAG